MKNLISDFYFSSYGKNSSKIYNFEYKNDHISKTKNCINQKFHFSFVSGHCASLMYILPLMKVNLFWSVTHIEIKLSPTIINTINHNSKSENCYCCYWELGIALKIKEITVDIIILRLIDK